MAASGIGKSSIRRSSSQLTTLRRTRSDEGTHTGFSHSHLKPGGYFEQVEIDFIPQGDALRGEIFQQWANDLCHAMDLAGQPIRIDEQTSQKLRNAGFQVQEKTIRLPFSPWPNDQQEHSIGRWMNLVLTFGIEGLTMAPFTRILKRSPEEVSDMVRDVKVEICRLRYQGFCNL